MYRFLLFLTTLAVLCSLSAKAQQPIGPGDFYEPENLCFLDLNFNQVQFYTDPEDEDDHTIGIAYDYGFDWYLEQSSGQWETFNATVDSVREREHHYQFGNDFILSFYIDLSDEVGVIQLDVDGVVNHYILSNFTVNDLAEFHLLINHALDNHATPEARQQVLADLQLTASEGDCESCREIGNNAFLAFLEIARAKRLDNFIEHVGGLASQLDQAWQSSCFEGQTL